MTNAFQFRMPAGIPGDVNRAESATVETQQITAAGDSGAPTEFGVPVQIDSATGLVRIIEAADVAAYGMLVRPYPTNNSTDGLGTSTPQASGPCDVLRRGYMTVKLGGNAAAVKGGAVYVWYGASAGAHVQGRVEAAATGGSTLALPASWSFMGPADANGNVEIAVNI